MATGFSLALLLGLVLRASIFTALSRALAAGACVAFSAFLAATLNPPAVPADEMQRESAP